MPKEGGYRHELKYQIRYAEYLAIRRRLQTVMQPDEHARPDGRYIIRSIYFDDPDDHALQEKLDGAQKREKFRIRYYNDDLSFITLEKKIKINHLCLKLDAGITEEECRAILSGPRAWMATHPAGLVRELYCKMQGCQLRPRVLVSYLREPYVYGPGNVRVTFDSDIRTSLFHPTFLEEQPSDISATDTPVDMIMEVKYDAFLPEIISDLIQSEAIRQQAFSKYSICRRFG